MPASSVFSPSWRNMVPMPKLTAVAQDTLHLRPQHSTNEPTDQAHLPDYMSTRGIDVRDALEQVRGNPQAMMQFRKVIDAQGKRLTSRYVLLDSVLGSGRNGGVRLGYDYHQDTFVALKRYRKAYSLIRGRLQYSSRDQVYNNALRHEMWMDRKMSRLDGFLHMREVFETPRSIYYVMDLADGTLYDLICPNNHGTINERQLRRLLLPVVRGLAHAHRIGYAHRDLKLDNLLVVRRADGAVELRLADLEFTAFCNYETGFDIMGSAGYMAPEVESFSPNRSVDYRKADAWSLGVVIYACLTGHFPFDPERPVYHQRLSFKAYPWMSAEVQNLLCGLLDKDPDTRLSLGQAMRHPFFKRSANRRQLV